MALYCKVKAKFDVLNIVKNGFVIRNRMKIRNSIVTDCKTDGFYFQRSVKSVF